VLDHERGRAGHAVLDSTSSLSRRQQEVLDALETAFLDQGFRRPTVGELAARAQCSRRTLYEIAPTKGEMFLVVLDRMLWRMDHGAREHLHAHGDPASRIEALLAGGITAFRPAGAEFVADLNSYKPAQMLFTRHTDRVRGSIIRLVNEGIASGQFLNVNPDIVSEVMLIATRQMTDPAFLARTGQKPSEAMSLLYDFLRHGLVAAKS
jgi:AcrR family transcriptional regulator